MDGPNMEPKTAYDMSKARFIEGQTDVGDVTARLSDAVAQAETELIRDATIRRFKITFEVVWKTLKLYLEHRGHECNGPRPTLEKAFKTGLIGANEEADVWMLMLDDHNLTRHAYDEALTSRIYRNIVKDHAPRLKAMAERIGNLCWT